VIALETMLQVQVAFGRVFGHYGVTSARPPPRTRRSRARRQDARAQPWPAVRFLRSNDLPR